MAIQEKFDALIAFVFDSIATLAISIGFFGSIGIGIFQSFMWLRDGEWTKLPLHTGLGYIGLETQSEIAIESWQGLAKILTWFLNLPSALMLILFSIILSAIFKVVSSDFKGPDFSR